MEGGGRKKLVYSPITMQSCSSTEDPDVDKGGAGFNIKDG